MKSTNNNEKDTKLEAITLGGLSTHLEINETLAGASHLLLETYKVEDETPESLLIGHALRLNNVSHSLVEDREKNYLEGKTDENTRKIDHDDLNAICRLSHEARENIKLAMQIKREKVSGAIGIITAIRGKQ